MNGVDRLAHFTVDHTHTLTGFFLLYLENSDSTDGESDGEEQPETGRDDGSSEREEEETAQER